MAHRPHVGSNPSRIAPAVMIISALLLATCLTDAAHAQWTLTGGGVSCTIDQSTGAIDALASDKAGPILRPNRHEYSLVLPEGEPVVASEADDEVRDADAQKLPGELTVRCHNAKLQLDITKTYRLDDETGWLFCTISAGNADRPKAFFRMAADVQVAPAFWARAMIHHPTMHSGTPALIQTRDVTKPMSLDIAKGAGYMAIANTRKGATLAVFQSQIEGEPVFFDAVWVGGRAAGGAVTLDRGRWRHPLVEGPVGGGIAKPFTTQYCYAVTHGDHLDALFAYAQQPDVRDMVDEAFFDAPAWIDDVIIDEAFDLSTLDGFRNTWSVVGQKMPYGLVMVSLWGQYGEYNQDHLYLDEQVHAWEGKKKTYSEEFIAKYWPHGHSLDKSNKVRYLPSATAKVIQDLKAVSPRLRIGIYTHFSSATHGVDAPSFQEHPEWAARDGKGERYHGRGEWAMDDDYASIRLNNALPEVQKYFLEQWEGILRYVQPDFMYIDGTPRAQPMHDWPRHQIFAHNGNNKALFRGLVQLSNKHGKVLKWNYPVSVFAHEGYHEYPAFGFYERDWRLSVARMVDCLILSAPEFRISFAGDRPSSADPTDPMNRFRLNCLLMQNVKMSLLNAPGKTQWLLQTMPYLMAHYELRQRHVVNARISPNGLTDGSEIEAHAWRMRDAGLVTLMNHDVDAATVETAFDIKPMGLRPGRPVYVWRLELPDPQHVDFADVSEDSPIRRLARQSLIAQLPKAPKRLTLSVELPSEQPVMLLLAQSPAMIESVNGVANQFHLPQFDGIRTTGLTSPDGRQLDVTIESDADNVAVLIPMPEGATDVGNIRQRKWHETTGEGVAPGYDAIEHTIVEQNSKRCVRVLVGIGSTQVLIN